jgi:hypothetical protein
LALATTDDRTSDQVNLSTRTSFHRLTGEWLWNPTATLSNRLSPTFGLDVATFDMGEGAVEMITVTGLLRDEVSWRLHPRLELRPGIEAGIVRYQFSAFAPAIRNWNVPGSDVARRFDAGFDETGEKEEISKAIHAGSFAAYVDAIWQPWDFLKVIPGVRAQSYFYLGREKFRADPRLTVRADVGAGVTLKAGAGLYSKLPPEFYLDPDYGNPDLDMEWAEQYSAGVEYTIARVLGIDLQGFYIRRHDKASRSRTVGVDDAGNVTRVPYENDARGRAYGLELLLRHDMTERFYGWLAYTLSRSEEAQAFDQELNPSRFDQTHILTAVASVRLGRGWEVGTRFRLVSGNPTTPRLDSTYLADTGRYTPYLGSRDSARLGLFHQLDFRVEKTWEFEKWMFAMYLDVQNVYYAKNPEFRIWDYRSRKSYEITGIPILPTLGFKGEF